MSRLSTVTEYWDKTPRNHKQLTFILLSHAIVVRRKERRRIVVSSLVCSLHEKMFWQTSRERDHGEDQHVEQNHPVHFTGHCRHHGAYIGREWCCLQTRVLWKLIIIMLHYKVKYEKLFFCLRFINKSPLLTSDLYLQNLIFDKKYKQNIHPERNDNSIF